MRAALNLQLVTCRFLCAAPASQALLAQSSLELGGTSFFQLLKGMAELQCK